MGDSIKPGLGLGSADDKKSADSSADKKFTDAAASSSGTSTDAAGSSSPQISKGGAKRALATNSQPDEATPPVVDVVPSLQDLEPSRANVGTQTVDPENVYRITEGYSITSPRGMLSGGEVVTPKDFGGSQERMDELVTSKVLTKGVAPNVQVSADKQS